MYEDMIDQVDDLIKEVERHVQSWKTMGTTMTTLGNEFERIVEEGVRHWEGEESREGSDSRKRDQRGGMEAIVGKRIEEWIQNGMVEGELEGVIFEAWKEKIGEIEKARDKLVEDYTELSGTTN